jgi:putative transposase
MNSHRKTVKRFHEPGDCHELTFSSYRRIPLLTNDGWRHLLAESLDQAVEAQSCRLIAYVFMPEHVHILIQPTSCDVRMDLVLKALKAPFFRRIKRRLEVVGSPLLERLTVLERAGTHRFRFFQEGGGYDRNLQSAKAVEAAIAYIHENPVRRQLCEKSADWRRSSALHYEQGGQETVRLELPPSIQGPTRDFHA